MKAPTTGAQNLRSRAPSTVMPANRTGAEPAAPAANCAANAGRPLASPHVRLGVPGALARSRPFCLLGSTSTPRPPSTPRSSSSPAGRSPTRPASTRDARPLRQTSRPPAQHATPPPTPLPLHLAQDARHRRRLHPALLRATPAANRSRSTPASRSPTHKPATTTPSAGSQSEGCIHRTVRQALEKPRRSRARPRAPRRRRWAYTAAAGPATWAW
jgi:hypothetical protein